MKDEPQQPAYHGRRMTEGGNIKEEEEEEKEASFDASYDDMSEKICGKRSCSETWFEDTALSHNEELTGSHQMPGSSIAELVEDSISVGLLHLSMDVVARVAKFGDFLC